MSIGTGVPEKKSFSAVHTGTRVIPTNIPPIAYSALMLAWLIYIYQCFIRVAVTTLEPVYGTEFHLNAIALLAIPLVFSVSQALLSPSIVHATDKLGGGFSRRHWIIICSAVPAILVTLIAFKSLSGTIVGLIILLVATGLFLGPGEPLVCTMAGDWFPMENRGFAIGFHHTGFPWGSLVGGLVISALLAFFGVSNWRIVFMFLPLLSIVVVWWGLYQITLKKQRELISDTSKRGLHVSVHDEVLPSEIEEAGKQERLGLGESLKIVGKNPTALVMVINGFLVAGAYWVWMGWLPLWLYNIGHYSASKTAAYAVIFAITGGLGQLIWGSVSDGLGRKLSLLIIFVWAMVGFYFMQFSLISMAWLIGTQLFVGFATNASYPIFYTAAFDVADKKTKGAVMGLVDFGIYVGALWLLVCGVLINAGGGLGSKTGYVWVLLMEIVLLIVAFLVTLLFSRETKGWFFKKDWSLLPRWMSNVPEE